MIKFFIVATMIWKKKVKLLKMIARSRIKTPFFRRHYLPEVLAAVLY